MKLEVDIQNASKHDSPKPEQIEQWIGAALQGRTQDAEVSIRIVDETEMTDINRLYCDKNKPTNVLSFPADIPDELNFPLLGDIVICASVVAEEAKSQSKSELAHWAHMLVHGTLHLLGHDHIKDADAEKMQACEVSVLQQLGYSDPYHCIST